MQAWNFEADLIDADDSLKQEELVVNEFIRDYLHNKSDISKLFLIAPKGLGKTLILKTKSILYREGHSGIKCIPEQELCEKISITNFSMSWEEFVQLEKLDPWLRIWKMCICLSIMIQCGFPVPDIITHRMGKAKEISEILNVILQDRHFFIYREGWRLYDSEMLPVIRQQKQAITIFVDSLDQAVSQLIRAQQFGAPDEEKSKHIVNVWACAQLGLLHAAHQLCVQNRFIKIFATIREEAFEMDESDVHLQIKDYSVFIKYEKSELKEIFESNISKTTASKLCQPKEEDPFVRFFGFKKIQHSFVKHVEEDIFEFMYRHSFGRPRELVLIGRRIYEMNPDKRDTDSIRKAVNMVSHNEIFDQFKKEIIPFFDSNELTEFCSKLHHNVFTHADAELLNQKQLSFYLKLGLIGRTKKIMSSGKYFQDFNIANKFNPKEGLIVPRADYYFTHPAMDGLLIDTLKKEYNHKNIIGYGLPFEMPDEFNYSGVVKTYPRSREIHVLIASPSDVEVRGALLNSLETQFRKKRYEAMCGCRIIPRGWEELASQAGYVQSVINEKILKEIDVVIAIIRHQLGTPTIDPVTKKVKQESGTVEELFFGLDSWTNNKKKIIVSVYFSAKAPTIAADARDRNKILREWDRVTRFKKQIQDKVLYKHWNDEDDLYDIIIDDLRDNINDSLGASTRHSIHP